MSIVYDLSIEDYHNQVARCSHSRFRDFVKYGPRFYFERFVMRTLEKKPTAAMIIGQLFETLLQEGDAIFEAKIFVQTVDGRSCKPQLEAARAAGKTVLKAAEYAAFQAWRASLFDNAEAMALIEPANMQASILGNAFGLPMQSRPDYLNLEGLAATGYAPYTVDLKTCESINDLRGSAGKLFALGYHTQAALCRALLRNEGVVNSQHYILAVEKSGAHRTQLIRIPDRVLDWADGYFAKYAPELAHCIHSNTWPRTEPTIELDLPGWAGNPNAAPTDELTTIEEEEI